MKMSPFFFIFPTVAMLIFQSFSYLNEQEIRYEKLNKFYFQVLGIGSILFGTFIAAGLFSTEYILNALPYLEFSPSRALIFIPSSILFSIVSRFSFSYLHKDHGFTKFFINFNIFWLGLFLFIFGKESLVLFAGWELIGVSSIFLISYYTHREQPIYNSLFVVNLYKIADILVITSLLLFKHKDLLIHHKEIVPLIYIGLITAGLIKSGSFPFTPWLPRAMEGPTTSSAIFYGALATNTGVLLILFFAEGILQHSIAKNFLLYSGIATILYSSLQTRVQTNAKSLLAYSSSIQIGIILVEIAFGFTHFALVHLFLSSFLKVYQLIKTPSMLNSFHERVGENGESFSPQGSIYKKLIPKKIRLFLYYNCLHHFHLDSVYELIGLVTLNISRITKRIFHPLLNHQKNVSYWSLMWVIYYYVISYFINTEVIKINSAYFDLIPIFIFVTASTTLFQSNTSAFISSFMIYKILESFIVHGVHTHEPLKLIAYIILFLFIFLIVRHSKLEQSDTQSKKRIEILIISFMLYFTNFPFLLQSLVNEHIIEAFMEQEKLLDLILYCGANVMFNIGIYHFIFKKIYIKNIDYKERFSHERF